MRVYDEIKPSHIRYASVPYDTDPSCSAPKGNDMAKKTEGICALTGERGPFVKSHIIPSAFTPTYAPGKPMIQWTGTAGRPHRRWDGLYDLNLVTRAGEDILERYDTWAVNEFRKHHMVWSSWGPSLVVPPPHDVFPPRVGRSDF